MRDAPDKPRLGIPFKKPLTWLRRDLSMILSVRFDIIFCNRLLVLCQNATLSRLRTTLSQPYISLPFCFITCSFLLHSKSSCSVNSTLQSLHFSKFQSVNDVYNTTNKIQEEQGKTGNLRHLRKIQPYLERLQEYSSVIETCKQRLMF